MFQEDLSSLEPIKLIKSGQQLANSLVETYSVLKSKMFTLDQDISTSCPMRLKLKLKPDRRILGKSIKKKTKEESMPLKVRKKRKENRKRPHLKNILMIRKLGSNSIRRKEMSSEDLRKRILKLNPQFINTNTCKRILNETNDLYYNSQNPSNYLKFSFFYCT